MKAINVFHFKGSTVLQLPRGFVPNDCNVLVDGVLTHLNYSLSAGNEQSEYDTFDVGYEIPTDADFEQVNEVKTQKPA